MVTHNGYISMALLARFDANETFPRLPFEPINEQTYKEMIKDVIAKRKKICGEKTFF